jgi:hypothetical protein
MKLVSELENDAHLGAARLVFFLKSGDTRFHHPSPHASSLPPQSFALFISD